MGGTTGADERRVVCARLGVGFGVASSLGAQPLSAVGELGAERSQLIDAPPDDFLKSLTREPKRVMRSQRGG
jgi:hypothetical protein